MPIIDHLPHYPGFETADLVLLTKAIRLALGDQHGENWSGADDERLFVLLNRLLEQLGDHPLPAERFENLMESRQAPPLDESYDRLVEESHSDADPGL